MFNRWFIAILSIITVCGLLLVIFIDQHKVHPHETPSIDATEPIGASDDVNNDVYVQENLHTEQSRVTSYSDRPADRTLSGITEDRRNYMLDVLDTLEDERSRLPYMGELIRLYSHASMYAEASHWAAERARQTREFSDYIHSAELAMAHFQQGINVEIRNGAAILAKEMYISALELDSKNPEVLTDLAVVYMSLLQPEKSYETLTRALNADSGHVRAHFNTGVLLHQMGNASESIPFFERALRLARDPEWETRIQEYLDRHHTELYH